VIHVKVNSRIHLTGNIPKDVSGEIKTNLTMDNPQWIENERMGRWNGNTPRKLTFYQEDQDGLIIPRGYTRKTIDFLKSTGGPHELDVRTRELAEVDYRFSGELRPYQKDAVKKILKRRFGVVQMPPGSGKTVVALYCIAHRKQPALVIVHTKELMLQWAKRAESFLGLHGEQLGLIGDGHDSIGSRVTIAIVKSLYRRAPEVSKRIGFLVVDECHHVPARTFEEAVSAFDSHYMLGLSATPQRRDQLTRLIYLYMGDRVYTVDLADLQQSGTVMGARLVVRDTQFDYQYADAPANCLGPCGRQSPRSGLNDPADR
jgi:superfamily II DNA or RNA helicase